MNRTYSFGVLYGALLFFPLSLVLGACSGSPPLIQNLEWMPVFTRDSHEGRIIQELNFYAQLEDEDGLEDIDSLTIYKDDQGWFWTLTPETWVFRTTGGETWLGSGGLTRGGALPGGKYRFVVRDRSGQKSEKIFRLDSPVLEGEALIFPKALVVEDHLDLDSAEKEPVVLWFYNKEGSMIKEVYTRGGRFPLSDFLDSGQKKQAWWFMIYWQDEQGGYGMKSGPFYIHPQEGALQAAGQNSGDRMQDTGQGFPVQTPQDAGGE